MSAMDPRIARTRRSLRQALLGLARGRDFEEISVADIAESAGINRSTFYQHYADKSELLVDVLDAITSDLLTQVSADLEPEEAYQVLVRYMEHVRDNIALYRQIFSEAVAAGVPIRIRERLEGLLLTRAAGSELGGLPLPIAAASITGSAVAIIATWVRSSEPGSAEQVAGWIWQMVDLHGAIPRD
ncbi:TetR/AcrR family transcriptional regulator [Pseudactinotalea sp. Z1748]|uniref:TetR/AcrR family transcriptional regulator n=1 Tax=Pseudactinotalea sp. Z1748 TaxID=3413027 RepID=UPI003C7E7559